MSRHFSVQDFKEWISEQEDVSDFFEIDHTEDKFSGKSVKSKVGKNKLLERIEADKDHELLVEEFLKQGGTVIVVEDKRVQIETDSGEFYLPRFCVKIREN